MEELTEQDFINHCIEEGKIKTTKKNKMSKEKKLNVKVGTTNILKDKDKFLVSDLMRILNLINPETEVVFGAINDNNKRSRVEGFQSENFVFCLNKRSNETLEEYDTLEVLTSITDFNK